MAILSDLDGVLVDSTASVMRGWRRWAADRGLRVDGLEQVVLGRTSAEAVAKLAPELDAELEGEAVERMQTSDSGDVIALPGAAELLGGNGLPVAVVTSGTPVLARTRLRQAGLPVPDVLVTSEQVRHGKPDPEGYLLAATLLAVDPGQCVVLEDAPVGVEAGLAAGMHVVGIATSREPAELSRAHEIMPTVAAWLATVRSPGAIATGSPAP
jgi:sugar-phosphatase